MPHPSRRLGMIPVEVHARHGEDHHPGRGDRQRVRPRGHRLANVVAVHERADPLVPRVRGRRQRPQGQEVRRRRRLPPVLETQPEDGPEARDQARRRFRRRDPLPLPGWPDPVPVVAAELPGVRRVQGEVPRGEDPPTNLRDYHLDPARRSRASWRRDSSRRRRTHRNASDVAGCGAPRTRERLPRV